MGGWLRQPCVGAQTPSPNHRVAQTVKRLSAMQGTWVPSLGQEDPLEKRMTAHSSILAWRTPRTGEPGRLQSMGLQRVHVHFSHTPSPPPTMRWKEGEGDETPPSQDPLPSPAKPVPG